MKVPIVNNVELNCYTYKISNEYIFLKYSVLHYNTFHEVSRKNVSGGYNCDSNCMVMDNCIYNCEGF
jgi:hypothetical protein